MYIRNTYCHKSNYKAHSFFCYTRPDRMYTGKDKSYPLTSELSCLRNQVLSIDMTFDLEFSFLGMNLSTCTMTINQVLYLESAREKKSKHASVLRIRNVHPRMILNCEIFYHLCCNFPFHETYPLYTINPHIYGSRTAYVEHLHPG